MRFLLSAVFLVCAAFGASAQDGIYLTVSGGQKTFDVDKINSALMFTGDPYMTEFTPSFLTYSGEIHFIMGSRFVLGGKGCLFSQEQHAPFFADHRMKLFGHMMIGSLGFVILDGKSSGGLRVYPQIGAGQAQTNFQVKALTAPDNTFSTITAFGLDSLGAIKKEGLVIDACIGIDYDLTFIPAIGCMSGIATRPLLHAEFGYTFQTKELDWMRDSEDLNTTEPELKFNGLYYSIGIGFGFTGGK